MQKDVRCKVFHNEDIKTNHIQRKIEAEILTS